MCPVHCTHKICSNDELLKIELKNIFSFLTTYNCLKIHIYEYFLFTVGFRVEAAPFIRKFRRTPSLGDCTLGSHRYRGDIVYTPFPKVEYKYSQKSTKIKNNEYRDIIGGAGISLLGLVGASAKARVINTVKRDKKSLLIYSHFRIHKGMISLANTEVGTKWQSCSKLEKHYYLRDILTGMEDYLLVQLQFRSEAKRREVEVKIKVKFLFFSATKTIRRIKTEFTSDFSVSVYRVSTFPSRKEETLKFRNIDNSVSFLESLENGRMKALKDVEAAKFDDQRLHMDYFFQPCMIRTIIDSLPFKPAFNFVLIELIERSEEMQSVLQDIHNIKLRLSGIQKVKLEKLESEIQQRLNKIGDWKTKKLSNQYAHQLLTFYGTDKAPYYYERQLNLILNDP